MWNDTDQRAWRMITVRDKDAGRRLDAYLAKRFPSYSRNQISKYIKEGLVCSAHRGLKASSLLLAAEQIRLYVPGLVPDTPPPPLPEILYEDDRLMVINKPSGMLVHPSGDTFVWALIGLLKIARPDCKMDLVHRIDRETSGVILVSKDKDANSFLKIKLANREVYKTYHAIVRGIPSWETQEIHGSIALHPTAQVHLRRCVLEGGQPSHTTATVLKRMENHALVECKLHTGRTHQIRVHMESVGFPLLGDKLYGQPDEVFIEYLKHGCTDIVKQAVGFSRHCLHAAVLHFPHPDGGYKKVRAPLPTAMQMVVDGGEAFWEDVVGDGYVGEEE